MLHQVSGHLGCAVAMSRVPMTHSEQVEVVDDQVECEAEPVVACGAGRVSALCNHTPTVGLPDPSRADLLHPGFDVTLLSNDTSTAIPENDDCAYKVWNRMSSGSYFLPPVLAVEIPNRTAVGGESLG